MKIFINIDFYIYVYVFLLFCEYFLLYFLLFRELFCHSKPVNTLSIHPNLLL